MEPESIRWDQAQERMCLVDIFAILFQYPKGKVLERLRKIQSPGSCLYKVLEREGVYFGGDFSERKRKHNYVASAAELGDLILEVILWHHQQPHGRTQQILPKLLASVRVFREKLPKAFPNLWEADAARHLHHLPLGDLPPSPTPAATNQGPRHGNTSEHVRTPCSTPSSYVSALPAMNIRGMVGMLLHMMSLSCTKCIPTNYKPPKRSQVESNTRRPFQNIVCLIVVALSPSSPILLLAGFQPNCRLAPQHGSHAQAAWLPNKTSLPNTWKGEYECSCQQPRH
jgi:hypothetical protein